VRVAIVTETFLPRLDGIVRMLVEYLTYLERHGHEAIVFAAGEGNRACRGYPVLRVPGVAFPPYPQLIVAPYSRRMEPILRRWRPDIMHLAGPFILGAQGVAVARRLGVPAASHYQTDLARYAQHFRMGALSGLTWARLRAIHNACAVTLAPTPSVAQELRGHGFQRVGVCGRGVDGVLFDPRKRDEAFRAEITGGRDVPILTYVGRISVEKNLGLLARVARELPSCPLLIVGEGPAQASLRAEMSGLDVHFTGRLSDDALARAYASSDAFLFPSTTETFGQVVREAMVSGLPVVGLRAGGVQDLVRDGQTGFLCSPTDPRAFVEAARRLAGDASLRLAMGAEARREAEAYTWEAVFDGMMGSYGGLIAGRGAGEAARMGA